MGYRVVQIVSLLGLLLLFGAMSLLGSKREPDLPEFSKTPAAGLKLECGPYNASYSAGDYVLLSCALTNTNGGAVPLSWSPRMGNFCLSVGEEKRPGGRLLTGYPELVSPITIKSWGPHRDNYILYLPPNEKLTFQIHVGKTENPEEFKGRISYDPRPVRANKAMGGPVKWDDFYAFSPLFEYKVAPREE